MTLDTNQGFWKCFDIFKGIVTDFRIKLFHKICKPICWFLTKLKTDEIGFFHFLRFISTVIFYMHRAFMGCNVLHIVLRFFYYTFFQESASYD